jgi:hypothetical protein
MAPRVLDLPRQAIKRGVNRPPHAFLAQDLNAVNAYLTTVQ